MLQRRKQANPEGARARHHRGARSGTLHL